MKINIIIIFFVLSFSFQPSFAQVNLNESPIVLMTQANGLYDQGRYDEAIRIYNRILDNNQNYPPAILMKAKTKYELNAYKGVKMDCEKYIAVNGVTKEVIKLMGRTEIKLENFDAAKNYVLSALEMDPYDPEMHYLKGQINLDVGTLNDACESYYLAYELGWDPARQALTQYCKSYIPPKRIPLPLRPLPQEETQPKTPSDISSDKEESIDKGDSVLGDIIKLTEKREADAETHEDTTDSYPAPQDTDEENKVEISAVLALDLEYLNASQTIIIDDEISVVLTYGLGERQVKEVPEIFIVANENGHLTIDVCVDKRGSVVTTAFNEAESSINRNALTSLGMRKAREFAFASSTKERECGRIIYVLSVSGN